MEEVQGIADEADPNQGGIREDAPVHQGTSSSLDEQTCSAHRQKGSPTGIRVLLVQ
jgi:hypothetical protein